MHMIYSYVLRIIISIVDYTAIPTFCIYIVAPSPSPNRMPFFQDSMGFVQINERQLTKKNTPLPSLKLTVRP